MSSDDGKSSRSSSEGTQNEEQPKPEWEVVDREVLERLNRDVNENESCAIYLTPPADSASEMTMHYKPLFGDDPCMEHVKKTVELCKQPDSPIANTFQIVIMTYMIAPHRYDEIVREINPNWNRWDWMLTKAGACAMGKTRWKPGPEDAGNTPKRWTALNSTHNITAPGLLHESAHGFYPENNVHMIVYLVRPTVWGSPSFLTTMRDTFAPLYSVGGMACHPLSGPLLTLNWTLVYYIRNPGGMNYIDKMQADTGFHFFGNIERKDPRKLSPDQLSDYTADMVAAGCSLHVQVAILKGFIACCEQLREENLIIEEWAKTSNRDDIKNAQIVIEDWGKHMEHRSRAVLSYKDGWAAQATAAVQGLQNVVGQKNQEETRRIANESRTLAEQSKRLAEASWKDTTSVTAVTIITMLFLPATFMATLFSADFVQDNAFGGDAGKQATTYAAVTVPLTAAVVLGWYIWTTMRKRKAAQLLARRLTFELHKEKDEKKDA